MTTTTPSSVSPVLVIRQKGYEPGKGMKRFHAREVGNGKFYDMVTLEEFELGDDLEIEQKVSDIPHEFDL